MSEGQRIIKYIAIAFGTFLSVGIISFTISCLLFGFGIFGSLLGLNVQEESSISQEEVTFSETYEMVDNLKLDCKLSQVIFVPGDTLQVETKNIKQKFSSRISGNTLVIEESQSFAFWDKRENAQIKITIPRDSKFKEVKISAGAGKVEIEGLTTETLKLGIGAGNTKINDITVEKQADIDGGVGKVAISNASFKNLNLDVGVGDFKLSGKLIGDTDIDCGVGRLELVIQDRQENYTIKAKKGIGEFKIQNQSVEKDITMGNGVYRLEMDAGIGKTQVSFEE
ncbi:MAG: DUF4097 family beta strand repeat-containing protein [Clostridia bacterium]